MNNATIQIKIKQRLNKLSSNDFDNIQCWQIVEAFNKGQSDWCRRNLHGSNTKQEGDEQSTSRVDDLEVLLKSQVLVMVDKQTYFEASTPSEYMRWKRISVTAKSDCCPKPKSMVIYLTEQANVDVLLRDKNKQPSFEWGETFATMMDNKIQVYTNGLFTVENPTVTYYRQPARIQIIGCTNPYTQLISAVEIECEFKDDLIEVLVDEAAKIIAGDIESVNQVNRTAASVEANN